MENLEAIRVSENQSLQKDEEFSSLKIRKVKGVKKLPNQHKNISITELRIHGSTENLATLKEGTKANLNLIEQIPGLGVQFNELLSNLNEIKPETPELRRASSDLIPIEAKTVNEILVSSKEEQFERKLPKQDVGSQDLVPQRSVQLKENVPLVKEQKLDSKAKAPEFSASLNLETAGNQLIVDTTQLSEREEKLKPRKPVKKNKLRASISSKETVIVRQIDVNYKETDFKPTPVDVEQSRSDIVPHIALCTTHHSSNEKEQPHKSEVVASGQADSSIGESIALQVRSTDEQTQLGKFQAPKVDENQATVALQATKHLAAGEEIPLESESTFSGSKLTPASAKEDLIAGKPVNESLNITNLEKENLLPLDTHSAEQAKSALSDQQYRSIEVEELSSSDNVKRIDQPHVPSDSASIKLTDSTPLEIRQQETLESKRDFTVPQLNEQQSTCEQVLNQQRSFSVEHKTILNREEKLAPDTTKSFEASGTIELSEMPTTSEQELLENEQRFESDLPKGKKAVPKLNDLFLNPFVVSDLTSAGQSVRRLKLDFLPDQHHARQSTVSSGELRSKPNITQVDFSDSGELTQSAVVSSLCLARHSLQTIQPASESVSDLAADQKDLKRLKSAQQISELKSPQVSTPLLLEQTGDFCAPDVKAKASEVNLVHQRLASKSQEKLFDSEEQLKRDDLKSTKASSSLVQHLSKQVNEVLPADLGGVLSVQPTSDKKASKSFVEQKSVETCSPFLGENVKPTSIERKGEQQSASLRLETNESIAVQQTLSSFSETVLRQSKVTEDRISVKLTDRSALVGKEELPLEKEDDLFVDALHDESVPSKEVRDVQQIAQCYETQPVSSTSHLPSDQFQTDNAKPDLVELNKQSLVVSVSVPGESLGSVPEDQTEARRSKLDLLEEQCVQVALDSTVDKEAYFERPVELKKAARSDLEIRKSRSLSVERAQVLGKEQNLKPLDKDEQRPVCDLVQTDTCVSEGVQSLDKEKEFGADKLLLKTCKQDLVGSKSKNVNELVAGETSKLLDEPIKPFEQKAARKVAPRKFERPSSVRIGQFVIDMDAEQLKFQTEEYERLETESLASELSEETTTSTVSKKLKKKKPSVVRSSSSELEEHTSLQVSIIKKRKKQTVKTVEEISPLTSADYQLVGDDLQPREITVESIQREVDVTIRPKQDVQLDSSELIERADLHLEERPIEEVSLTTSTVLTSDRPVDLKEKSEFKLGRKIIKIIFKTPLLRTEARPSAEEYTRTITTESVQREVDVTLRPKLDVQLDSSEIIERVDVHLDEVQEVSLTTSTVLTSDRPVDLVEKQEFKLGRKVYKIKFRTPLLLTEARPSIEEYYPRTITTESIGTEVDVTLRPKADVYLDSTEVFGESEITVERAPFEEVSLTTSTVFTSDRPVDLEEKKVFKLGTKFYKIKFRTPLLLTEARPSIEEYYPRKIITESIGTEVDVTLRPKPEVQLDSTQVSEESEISVERSPTQEVSLTLSTVLTSDRPVDLEEKKEFKLGKRIYKITFRTPLLLTEARPSAAPTELVPVEELGPQEVSLITSTVLTSDRPVDLEEKKEFKLGKRIYKITFRTPLLLTEARPSAAPTELVPIEELGPQEVSLTTSTVLTSDRPVDLEERKEFKFGRKIIKVTFKTPLLLTEARPSFDEYYPRKIITESIGKEVDVRLRPKQDVRLDSTQVFEESEISVERAPIEEVSLTLSTVLTSDRPVDLEEKSEFKLGKRTYKMTFRTPLLLTEARPSATEELVEGPEEVILTTSTVLTSDRPVDLVEKQEFKFGKRTYAVTFTTPLLLTEARPSIDQPYTRKIITEAIQKEVDVILRPKQDVQLESSELIERADLHLDEIREVSLTTSTILTTDRPVDLEEKSEFKFGKRTYTSTFRTPLLLTEARPSFEEYYPRKIITESIGTEVDVTLRPKPKVQLDSTQVSEEISIERIEKVPIEEVSLTLSTVLTTDRPVDLEERQEFKFGRTIHKIIFTTPFLLTEARPSFEEYYPRKIVTESIGTEVDVRLRPKPEVQLESTEVLEKTPLQVDKKPLEEVSLTLSTVLTTDRPVDLVEKQEFKLGKRTYTSTFKTPSLLTEARPSAEEKLEDYYERTIITESVQNELDVSFAPKPTVQLDSSETLERSELPEELRLTLSTEISQKPTDFEEEHVVRYGRKIFKVTFKCPLVVTEARPDQDQPIRKDVKLKKKRMSVKTEESYIIRSEDRPSSDEATYSQITLRKSSDYLSDQFDEESSISRPSMDFSSTKTIRKKKKRVVTFATSPIYIEARPSDVQLDSREVTLEIQERPTTTWQTVSRETGEVVSEQILDRPESAEATLPLVTSERQPTSKKQKLKSAKIHTLPTDESSEQLDVDKDSPASAQVSISSSLPLKQFESMPLELSEEFKRGAAPGSKVKSSLISSESVLVSSTTKVDQLDQLKELKSVKQKAKRELSQTRHQLIEISDLVLEDRAEQFGQPERATSRASDRQVLAEHKCTSTELISSLFKEERLEPTDRPSGAASGRLEESQLAHQSLQMSLENEIVLPVKPSASGNVAKVELNVLSKNNVNTEQTLLEHEGRLEASRRPLSHIAKTVQPVCEFRSLDDLVCKEVKSSLKLRVHRSRESLMSKQLESVDDFLVERHSSQQISPTLSVLNRSLSVQTVYSKGELQELCLIRDEQKSAQVDLITSSPAHISDCSILESTKAIDRVLEKPNKATTDLVLASATTGTLVQPQQAGADELRIRPVDQSSAELDLVVQTGGSVSESISLDKEQILTSDSKASSKSKQAVIDQLPVASIGSQQSLESDRPVDLSYKKSKLKISKISQANRNVEVSLNQPLQSEQHFEDQPVKSSALESVPVPTEASVQSSETVLLETSGRQETEKPKLKKAKTTKSLAKVKGLSVDRPVLLQKEGVVNELDLSGKNVSTSFDLNRSLNLNVVTSFEQERPGEQGQIADLLVSSKQSLVETDSVTTVHERQALDSSETIQIPIESRQNAQLDLVLQKNPVNVSVQQNLENEGAARDHKFDSIVARTSDLSEHQQSLNVESKQILEDCKPSDFALNLSDSKSLDIHLSSNQPVPEITLQSSLTGLEPVAPKRLKKKVLSARMSEEKCKSLNVSETQVSEGHSELTRLEQPKKADLVQDEQRHLLVDSKIANESLAKVPSAKKTSKKLSARILTKESIVVSQIAVDENERDLQVQKPVHDNALVKGDQISQSLAEQSVALCDDRADARQGSSSLEIGESKLPKKQSTTAMEAVGRLPTTETDECKTASSALQLCDRAMQISEMNEQLDHFRTLEIAAPNERRIKATLGGELDAVQASQTQPGECVESKLFKEFGLEKNVESVGIVSEENVVQAESRFTLESSVALSEATPTIAKGSASLELETTASNLQLQPLDKESPFAPEKSVSKTASQALERSRHKQVDEVTTGQKEERLFVHPLPLEHKVHTRTTPNYLKTAESEFSQSLEFVDDDFNIIKLKKRRKSPRRDEEDSQLDKIQVDIDVQKSKKSTTRDYEISSTAIEADISLVSSELPFESDSFETREFVSETFRTPRESNEVTTDLVRTTKKVSVKKRTTEVSLPDGQTESRPEFETETFESGPESSEVTTDLVRKTKKLSVKRTTTTTSLPGEETVEFRPEFESLESIQESSVVITDLIRTTKKLSVKRTTTTSLPGEETAEFGPEFESETFESESLELGPESSEVTADLVRTTKKLSAKKRTTATLPGEQSVEARPEFEGLESIPESSELTTDLVGTTKKLKVRKRTTDVILPDGQTESRPEFETENFESESLELGTESSEVTTDLVRKTKKLSVKKRTTTTGLPEETGEFRPETEGLESISESSEIMTDLVGATKKLSVKKRATISLPDGQTESRPEFETETFEAIPEFSEVTTDLVRTTKKLSVKKRATTTTSLPDQEPVEFRPESESSETRESSEVTTDLVGTTKKLKVKKKTTTSLSGEEPVEFRPESEGLETIQESSEITTDLVRSTKKLSVKKRTTTTSLLEEQTVESRPESEGLESIPESSEITTDLVGTTKNLKFKKRTTSLPGEEPVESRPESEGLESIPESSEVTTDLVGTTKNLKVKKKTTTSLSGEEGLETIQESSEVTTDLVKTTKKLSVRKRSTATLPGEETSAPESLASDFGSSGESTSDSGTIRSEKKLTRKKRVSVQQTSLVSTEATFDLRDTPTVELKKKKRPSRKVKIGYESTEESIEFRPVSLESTEESLERTPVSLESSGQLKGPTPVSLEYLEQPTGSTRISLESSEQQIESTPISLESSKQQIRSTPIILESSEQPVGSTPISLESTEEISVQHVVRLRTSSVLSVQAPTTDESQRVEEYSIDLTLPDVQESARPTGVDHPKDLKKKILKDELVDKASDRVVSNEGFPSDAPSDKFDSVVVSPSAQYEGQPTEQTGELSVLITGVRHEPTDLIESTTLEELSGQPIISTTLTSKKDLKHKPFKGLPSTIESESEISIQIASKLDQEEILISESVRHEGRPDLIDRESTDLVDRTSTDLVDRKPTELIASKPTDLIDRPTDFTDRPTEFAESSLRDELLDHPDLTAPSDTQQPSVPTEKDLKDKKLKRKSTKSTTLVTEDVQHEGRPSDIIVLEKPSEKETRPEEVLSTSESVHHEGKPSDLIEKPSELTDFSSPQKDLKEQIKPSDQPSDKPSEQPSEQPSEKPSAELKRRKTVRKPKARKASVDQLIDSSTAFDQQLDQPLVKASDVPSEQPSEQPSDQPSDKTSIELKEQIQPSERPSDKPSEKPTIELKRRKTIRTPKTRGESVDQSIDSSSTTLGDLQTTRRPSEESPIDSSMLTTDAVRQEGKPEGSTELDQPVSAISSDIRDVSEKKLKDRPSKKKAPLSESTQISSDVQQEATPTADSDVLQPSDRISVDLVSPKDGSLKPGEETFGKDLKDQKISIDIRHEKSTRKESEQQSTELSILRKQVPSDRSEVSESLEISQPTDLIESRDEARLVTDQVFEEKRLSDQVTDLVTDLVTTELVDRPAKESTAQLDSVLSTGAPTEDQQIPEIPADSTELISEQVHHEGKPADKPMRPRRKSSVSKSISKLTVKYPSVQKEIVLGEQTGSIDEKLEAPKSETAQLNIRPSISTTVTEVSDLSKETPYTGRKSLEQKGSSKLVPDDKRRSLSVERKVVYDKEQSLGDSKPEAGKATCSLESKLVNVSTLDQPIEKEGEDVKPLKGRKLKARPSIQPFRSKSVKEVVPGQTLDHLKPDSKPKTSKITQSEISPTELNEQIDKNLTTTFSKEAYLHRPLDETTSLEIDASKPVHLQANIDLNNNSILIGEQSCLVSEERLTHDHIFKAVSASKGLVLNESPLNVSESLDQIDLEKLSLVKPSEKHLKSNMSDLLASNSTEQQCSLEREGEFDSVVGAPEERGQLNITGQLTTVVQEISRMESESLMVSRTDEAKEAKIQLSHQNQLARTTVHQSMENISDLQIPDLKRTSTQDLNETCSAFIVHENRPVEQVNLKDFDLPKSINQQNLSLTKNKSHSIEQMDLLEREQRFKVDDVPILNAKEGLVLEKHSQQNIDLGLEKESVFKPKPVRPVRKPRLSLIPIRSNVVKEIVLGSSLDELKQPQTVKTLKVAHAKPSGERLDSEQVEESVSISIKKSKILKEDRVELARDGRSELTIEDRSKSPKEDRPELIEDQLKLSTEKGPDLPKDEQLQPSDDTQLKPSKEDRLELLKDGKPVSTKEELKLVDAQLKLSSEDQPPELVEDRPKEDQPSEHLEHLSDEESRSAETFQLKKPKKDQPREDRLDSTKDEKVSFEIISKRSEEISMDEQVEVLIRPRQPEQSEQPELTTERELELSSKQIEFPTEVELELSTERELRISTEQELPLSTEQVLKLPKDQESPFTTEEELSKELQLADTMSISTIDSERELDFQVPSSRPNQINLKLIENLPSLQISEIKEEEATGRLGDLPRRAECISPKLQPRNDATLTNKVDELEQVTNLETKRTSNVLPYLIALCTSWNILEVVKSNVTLSLKIALNARLL